MIKKKVFLGLAIAAVCMFVFNSCTWPDVPAQECYPPDTTGVESSVVVWDGVTDDVSEPILEGATVDLSEVMWDGTDSSELGLTCDLTDISTTSEWTYPPYSDTIYELLELYKEYETECWNDSTEQCFNYYFRVYHLIGESLSYKTPCTKKDMDLGIDPTYLRTGKEWVRRDPTGKGFVKFLRKK